METVHSGLAKIRGGDATGDLLDILETFLDLAGDIKATSEQLAVHRTTLYNRLAKIQRLGDVDLHAAPERFHHGIVVAIPDGSHRSEEPGFPQAFPVCHRSVLAAVI
jgi:sugar diacid utilization regulator